jgi:tetratricopeptide (TPR) repeat protein
MPKMLQYFVISAFIFLGAGALRSQNLDSLRAVAEGTAPDSLRAEALCALCRAHVNRGNFDQAKELGTKGLELGEKSGSFKAQAECLNHLGIIDTQTGSYGDAILRFQKSLKFRIAIKDSVGMGGSLNNLGIVYRDLGDYAKALDYLLQALRMREKTSDSLAVAASLGNVATLYVLLGEFEKTLKYYKKSLEMRQKLGDKHGMGTLHDNIGGLYSQMGDQDAALRHFDQAQTFAKELDDPMLQARIHSSYAILYSQQKNFPQALAAYKNALALNEKLGNQQLIAHNYTNLSVTYNMMGNFVKSAECARRALAIAQDINSIKIAAQPAYNLSKAEAALGNWKAAYENMKLYALYQDSLLDEDKAKAVGVLVGKYETEKVVEEQRRKEEAEALAEAERKKRLYNMEYTVIFLMLFGVLMTLFLLGKFKIHPRIMSVALFIALLALFEFALVFTDPYIESVTDGEPMFQLLANLTLAIFIAPVHQILEKVMKNRIVKTDLQKIGGH